MCNTKKQEKMKPFDLKKVKAGVPVCTRDGRPVRIVGFDRRGSDFPIIGLITESNGGEVAASFRENGKHCYGGEYNNEDLFMAGKKKRGWINVYKSSVRKGKVLISGRLYETEKIAKDNAGTSDDYIGTFPFEWEG